VFTVYSRTVPVAASLLCGRIGWESGSFDCTYQQVLPVVVALEIPRQHLLEAWRTMHLDLL